MAPRARSSICRPNPRKPQTKLFSHRLVSHPPQGIVCRSLRERDSLLDFIVGVQTPAIFLLPSSTVVLTWLLCERHLAPGLRFAPLTLTSLGVGRLTNRVTNVLEH